MTSASWLERLDAILLARSPREQRALRVWNNEYVQKRLVTAIGRIGLLGALTKLQQFKRVLPDRTEAPVSKERRRWKKGLQRALDTTIDELAQRVAG